MARTLIGQLILRLRAEGLGEAKSVVGVMGDIERAARRVGAGGVGSWGIGFQKNLDKLKLAQSTKRKAIAQEIEAKAMDLAYVNPLLWAQRIIIIDKKVKGFHMSPSSLIGRDMAELWLSE